MGSTHTHLTIYRPLQATAPQPATGSLKSQKEKQEKDANNPEEKSSLQTAGPNGEIVAGWEIDSTTSLLVLFLQT
jgi:hypothetical protein